MNRHINTVRIDGNRIECGDPCILLHICSAEHIHAAFEEFPQHAYRHGKAERNYRHKSRRQIQLDVFMLIEHVHQCDPDGCCQKSVRRMQDIIPVGEYHIESMDFPQDLCCKDKEHDDYLQHIRQPQSQLFRQDRRQKQQDQRHAALHHIVPVMLPDLPDQRQND